MASKIPAYGIFDHTYRNRVTLIKKIFIRTVRETYQDCSLKSWVLDHGFFHFGSVFKEKNNPDFVLSSIFFFVFDFVRAKKVHKQVIAKL